MRTVLFFAVFAIGAVAAGCLTQPAQGQKSNAVSGTAARIPVIVELFTSEGCSSCPPADRALKFLAEQQPVPNAEVIPLAFHVDYWDNAAWKDRFSSAAFSRRQELYVSRFGLDSSYTPEMVVDGRSEFIGNDTGKASKKIAEAANDAKGNVVLNFDGDVLKVRISGLTGHHPATVFLAITEDDITSVVNGGENGGQTFNHSSVVRSLTSLGLVEKAASTFESKTAVPAVVDLKPEKARIVVFVQDNDSRKIIAANFISLVR